MINTADSPIMKIFELFSSEQSEKPVEGKTPTVNSKTPADSPMTTTAESN
jgi:hypothetical protein